MEFIKSRINILYFCLYLTERTMHFAFNKINVFLLLYKIPHIKKRMKNKYGIENPLEFYNDFWTNKEYGFSQNFVFGAFLGIISILILTLGIHINKLFELKIIFESYHLIILILLSFILSNLLVYNNKTYLEYFKKFEKWSVKRKIMNVVLCYLFIFFVFRLFILSI